MYIFLFLIKSDFSIYNAMVVPLEVLTKQK